MSFNVVGFCSYRYGQSTQTSVVETSGVTAVVYAVTGPGSEYYYYTLGDEKLSFEASGTSAAIKQQIINELKVTLNLNSLAAGKYTVLLCATEYKNNCHNRTGQYLRNVMFSSIPPSGDDDQEIARVMRGFLEPVHMYNLETERPGAVILTKASNGTFSTLYFLPNNSASSNGYASVIYNRVRDSSDPNCVYRASPLIVDTNGDGISLSARTKPPKAPKPNKKDGQYFNIDVEGDKDLISWPLYADDMFLALPNANGQVVDGSQLFGNNTIGPDGKPADNGFQALAKFDVADSVRDGIPRIGREDPVFTKLRLWSDANRDGVSQANELITLDNAGIESIRLDYEDILEVDKYLNASRQRSVVELSVGAEQRPIIDIWFAMDVNQTPRNKIGTLKKLASTRQAATAFAGGVNPPPKIELFKKILK